MGYHFDKQQKCLQARTREKVRELMRVIQEKKEEAIVLRGLEALILKTSHERSEEERALYAEAEDIFYPSPEPILNRIKERGSREECERVLKLERVQKAKVARYEKEILESFVLHATFKAYRPWHWTHWLPFLSAEEYWPVAKAKKAERVARSEEFVQGLKKVLEVHWDRMLLLGLPHTKLFEEIEYEERRLESAVDCLNALAFLDG